MKKANLSLPGRIRDEKVSILVDKIVDFSFMGEKLKFCLSHALFSSFDVDVGTKLLLKTVAQRINFEKIVKTKDIGAGAGIIGICLKKKFPHIDVTFTDRDMLALDFTKLNNELNGIGDYRVSGELGIRRADIKYDFIVSNIPAKIGDKGLEDFIKKMILSVAADGICAVVVIKPLTTQIREILAGAGAALTFEEMGKAHWVVHFKAPENLDGIKVPADEIAPYIRDNIAQKDFGFSYKLKTVFNLPDFDTMGYQSELLLDLLKNEKPSGACLFWNPGQGRVPVLAHKIFPGKISRYILAGRDLLQLQISRDNLIANGVQAENISVKHVSLVGEIMEPVQNYIIIPDVIPMTDGYDITLKDLRHANIFISDKSTNIFRLLEKQNAYRVVKRIKKNGFTGIYLRRH